MRLPITLLAVIVIGGVAVAGLIAYSLLSIPLPSCTSTWKCAAPYPLQGGGIIGVAGQQCVADATNVFCVGGVDASGALRNGVYTATVSPSGNITGWHLSPSVYPETVSGESCAATSGFLYCVGGIHDGSGDDVAAAYYARLFANGSLSAWQSTTPYPVAVDSESCVASSSDIYCVGGNNETDDTVSTVAPSSTVWFATVNSSGIGGWAKTTPYPSGVLVPACLATGNYVYCLGGSDSNRDPLGTVYFAPLTAGGVGGWALTTNYPVASVDPSCVMASGRIYCIGGETAGGQPPSFTNVVYYASISASGVGAWQQGQSYPRDVGTSCVTAQGNAYCVGGFDESTPGLEGTVNYASLSSISG